VLQYKGDHRSLGYWYNWVKYKDRDARLANERETVHCGQSYPLLWMGRQGGDLLGYYDNSTGIGWFSHDKKSEQVIGLALDNMLILVRELIGGPPGCECPSCPKEPPKNVVRVMLNEWADFRAGDPFPPAKVIRALGRSLNTLPGETPDQYVALWYQQGEPVMGRVWKDANGKIAANFSWGGHEYKNNIGSLQILFELPEAVRGFDYDWRDFKEAANFGQKEWFPVHVDFHKGDISPAVIIIDGKEVLGKADIRNERACAGYGGEEVVLTGPAVHSSKVLCRKAKAGCKFD